MQVDPRIEQTLRSAEPLGQLRSLVGHLRAQGLQQQTILDLFEQARQQLRQAGRNREEDTIMEVMDFLVGWCSPHMSLRPEDGSKLTG
jgi:hypothetical protein